MSFSVHIHDLFVDCCTLFNIGLEIVQEVYTNRFPKCHQTSHALLLSLLVSHMCYFRVGWVLGPSHLVIRQLLIMSGDVELNPGPLDHGRLNLYINFLSVKEKLPLPTPIITEIEEILSQVDNTTFGRQQVRFLPYSFHQYFNSQMKMTGIS